MKTVKYCKSKIYSFFELSDSMQNSYLSLLGPYAEAASYVNDPLNSDNKLCLSDFLTFERPGLFDGYFGLSYFSAYYIKLNSCGDGCLVAYKVG